MVRLSGVANRKPIIQGSPSLGNAQTDFTSPWHLKRIAKVTASSGHLVSSEPLKDVDAGPGLWFVATARQGVWLSKESDPGHHAKENQNGLRDWPKPGCNKQIHANHVRGVLWLFCSFLFFPFLFSHASCWCCLNQVRLPLCLSAAVLGLSATWFTYV